MRNIWFISDTHFHHDNILKFTMENGEKVRPEFSSVQEMDEFMIEKWNANIKPNDYVYHLADISMNENKFLKETLPILNGKIRFIIGNHDKDIRGYLKYTKIEKLLCIRRFDNFVCSHIPLHKFSLFNHRTQDFMINVHGHIHRHDVGEDNYINISVEKTDYTPVHYEEIKRMMAVS